MKKMLCPLCEISKREPENILWEGKDWEIVRTKNLKGHKERVMILQKEHDKNQLYNIPKNINLKLKQIFNYTYKIVIMEGRYGSIPEHYHLCVTDLDPKSNDFEQILGTNWIKIIDIKQWK